MSVEKAGNQQQVSHATMKAAARLRNGGPYREGLHSPEGIKNAFEALLLGQILKPMQESLQRSGTIPKGAAGDIYTHFWQTHLSSLLADQIDIAPGWDPTTRGEPAGKGTIQPLNNPARQWHPLNSDSGSAVSLGTATPLRPLEGADRRMDPTGGLLPPVINRREPILAPASKKANPIPSRLQPSAKALAPFEAEIESAAADSGLTPNWIRAVIIQESSGRSDAVSNQGAQGLMQLMPATANALGVRDSFDPAENISGGARYLGKLMQRFGDPRLALAAYNAGPTRVEDYGAVPPIRETQNYVNRVMALKQDFDMIWPEPR
jgi:Transglycosylase SLT domain